MRPILVIVIILLFIMSTFYDLNIGTIPDRNNDGAIETPADVEETEPSQSQGELSLSYQEIIVESGHTVYGIVKALHEEDGFVIPPHMVVEDFEALNPKVEAHKILIGQAYRFPVYSIDKADEHS